MDASKVDLPTQSVVLAILALLFLTSAEVVAGTDGGHIWSRSGKAIGREIATESVRSPNGRYAVVAGDGLLRLVTPRRSSELQVAAMRGLSEVVWSPDAMAFAVNWTDGGAVGTWLSDVFVIEGDDVARHLYIRDMVLPHLDGFTRCDEDEPEEANVALAGWLAGGREMLVVAQVPPHSSCRNMGEQRGLRMDLATGRILEQMPERELWSRYRPLLVVPGGEEE